jgi:hypothetical protein
MRLTGATKGFGRIPYSKTIYSGSLPISGGFGTAVEALRYRRIVSIYSVSETPERQNFRQPNRYVSCDQLALTSRLAGGQRPGLYGPKEQELTELLHVPKSNGLQA